MLVKILESLVTYTGNVSCDLLGSELCIAGLCLVLLNMNGCKIPKGKDAESLTLEECREIVADESNHSKGGAHRRTTRTRSAAKKTTTKK